VKAWSSNTGPPGNSPVAGDCEKKAREEKKINDKHPS